ncbi:alpha/beta hydrolase [Candidatus Latescibacterota bacterium]
MIKLKAIKNVVCCLIVISLISLVCVPLTTYATLITVRVHSPALDDNMLGDAPDRSVLIYLPPDYKDNPDKRYPVIYLLHGFTCDHTAWLGECYIPMTVSFDSLCSNLIEQEIIQPMIIVMPDARNKYLGSWYTNSAVTGNWEDFITQDLVAYVDSTYRTIPLADSRGIAGHSMGGFGAMKLVMKHPEIYCAVYSLSGVLDFDNFYLDRGRNNIMRAVKADTLDNLPNLSISSAVAFAPNPNTQPFLCDFPLDENEQVVESVWGKWLQYDPLTMISSYRKNLMQLQGIRFDCGVSDGWCYAGNLTFSQALKDENIPYVFEEYEGNHTNEIQNRIENYLLPFFSEVLAYQVE